MCSSALECLPEAAAPPQQQEADPNTELVLGAWLSPSDIDSELPLLHVSQMVHHSASQLDILY